MSEPARFHARMRSEPWIVPGAIAFLKAYTEKHPGCNVLEFGGGASTIWFLRQGCRVVSYENKQGWRERILNVAANREIVTKEQVARLDLREWQDDIPTRLADLFAPESFDISFVDDLLRLECIMGSIPLIRPGGVLMLDNAGQTNRFVDSDWDWTLCVQGTPDKFNVSHGAWSPGWVTAWWQKPGPLEEAVYYDCWSEHKR